MIGRHARRRLAGYAQGRLPPAGRRRVEEHLAACPSCRAALDEIRFGIRLAGAVPRALAPAALWGSIERALDGGGADVQRPAPPAWRRGLVYAAPLVPLAAGVVWLVLSRPELRVRHAPPALTTIERAALEEHDRRLRGEAEWGIRSASCRRGPGSPRAFPTRARRRTRVVSGWWARDSAARERRAPP
jgi:anti-sigma factor RsiW